jgi:hypothetical protein
MVKSGGGRVDGAQITFRQVMEFSKIYRVNGEVTPPGNLLKKPGFVSGHTSVYVAERKMDKKPASKVFHDQL